MIGLDSNIILRAITNDDPKQSPCARAFLGALTAADQGVLNPVVLAEISWTLRKRYRRPHSEVLLSLDDLLRSDSYFVTDRDAVNRAIERCSSSNLEFADSLIGELNLIAGAGRTVTFDKEAAATPAFERLE